MRKVTPQGGGKIEWLIKLDDGQPPADILYFLAHMKIDCDGQMIDFNRNQKDAPKLNSSALMDAKLRLCRGRPLLFLNGCESNGQDPLTLISLVNEFLQRGASGAIGTEIAVFLDMATRFAETFVAVYGQAASGQSVSVGEAIRRARWQLLAAGSPLGLVYTCFGLVHLHRAVSAVNGG